MFLHPVIAVVRPWPLTMSCCAVALLAMLAGCRALVDATDRDVASVIAERQRSSLSYQAPTRVSSKGDPLRDPEHSAYVRDPNPRSAQIPTGFEVRPGDQPLPTTQPETRPSAAGDEAAPRASRPVEPGSLRLFTLVDALGYAQGHRRALETAEENLYRAALALTLERHLWTPIFASNLRTVYGNFGEVRNFDQAMRFVGDLSASQRLPYGGEFTAKAISTLIRDVKKTLTASEGSSVELGLKVPFLRGAGHIAREQLIQLERELTYSVRTFERFRRQQLVDVAAAYFDLLRFKQTVIDNEKSVARLGSLYERAREFQVRGLGSLLETQRAEQSYLTAQTTLEDSRERFRSQADRFKLLIGMPVDEPLDMEQLEEIETIERQVAEGSHPLLLRPPAVETEASAIQVAIENRLDLLTRRDRIDDARRGVAVAKNGLLPDLNLDGTVTWDTDPAHWALADFSYERTTWRGEVVLGLPLERTAERNQYRSSLLDVRQAQREYQEAVETTRAEVRSAINQIRLQDRALTIQRKNLQGADMRLEYANIQYEQGQIGNRDLVEAENDWTAARARLNLAKTEGWIALLQFRLATETLRIEDYAAGAGVDGTVAPP